MHCKSYSHFFSKKFQHICVSLDVNFNESLTNNVSLTNDVVSFEQLGPVVFFFCVFLKKKKKKKNDIKMPSTAVVICTKRVKIDLLILKFIIRNLLKRKDSQII